MNVRVYKPSGEGSMAEVLESSTFDSDIVPYCQVFCDEKQENMAILQLHAFASVIPAKGMPE
jgi:hypothetical protein